MPVQYLFVATRSFDPFVATLPLVATLGLPLLALCSRDTRDLLDRVTACGWGLLACVYCVSHAVAILMLDIPGFSGRNGLLVAFLVIVAKADDLRHCVFAAFARRTGACPHAERAAHCARRRVVGTRRGVAGRRVRRR